MKTIDAEGFAAVSARAGLSGWIAKNLPGDFSAGFLADPERFFADPAARVLKDDAKTRVVRIKLPGKDGAARKLVAKRFRYRSPLRRLGFLFSESPAMRSLGGALLLEQKGFHTPEPLAALEFRGWKRLGTSYYLAAEVEDGCSLRAFWLDVAPALPTGERIRAGRSIIRGLAKLFAGLHAAGLYHGDLKGSNILMRDWKIEARRFFLVDLDRVGERRLSPAERMKNLLQIKVHWGPRERLYFYLRYAALAAASKPEAKALARRVLALQRRHSRPARLKT